MLFEELIEQHRVHHFVPHALYLAVVIAVHKVGIHLFDLLGDQTKAERLGVVILFF